MGSVIVGGARNAALCGRGGLGDTLIITVSADDRIS
jgi:hypothetical protein